MKSISLHRLYHAISTVSAEAVLNQLQIKNGALRQYLSRQFRSDFGSGGSFLSDPLIECTFGWASSESEGKPNTMVHLAEEGVISKQLVEVMDRAPAHPNFESEDREKGIARVGYDDQFPENDDARWPAWRAPYAHQLKSWRVLGQAEPISTVVTAGTGSGKSECFMVPLLDSLARQSEETGGPLVGVQAIMLYPLNALINSQRDRLSAWTRGFDGRVRYALYNGETPKKPEPKTQAQASWARNVAVEEVDNRRDIRETPPSILVTNATMLEYMLVRPEDRPIIEKSQGKLKWIVLDEAHTLMGSAAAETSLLLRRTMHAFGVDPKDVRFVATSATIGDSKERHKTEAELKTFLAELAGVSVGQVAVVHGDRDVPKLPEFHGETDPLPIEELEALTSGTAYEVLSKMTLMRSLRDHLKESPMQVSEIARHLHPAGHDAPLDRKALETTLRIVDVATDAYPNGDVKKDAFLPVRAHLFHRSQRGLWACINPHCQGKAATELEDGWPFGRVYLDEQSTCKACEHPVFELAHCASCNEPTLNAVRYLSDGKIVFKPRDLDVLDDFADEVDYSVDTDTNAAQAERDENVQLYTKASSIDTRRAEAGGSTEAILDPQTCEVMHAHGDGLPILYTVASRDSGLRCACCNQVEKHEGVTFKRAILGAPFLMGNIVPEMLKHVPTKYDNSLRGRRLITFTDSRQGTARFSARLQLDAERRWTRSAVYHHLISKMPRDVDSSSDSSKQAEELSKIDEELTKARAEGNTIVAEILEEKLAQLQSPKKPKRQPVFWNDIVDHLSRTPEIRLLSGEDGEDAALPGEYAEREDELGRPRQLARLFLLREFARRPKNANNLESLGLVKLVYPAIEEITESDAREHCRIWFDVGFTLDQWKAFLKLVVDFYIREETLVNIFPSESHWMGARLFPRLCQGPDFIFDTDEKIKAEQKKAFRVFPSVRGHNRSRFIRLVELASNRSVDSDPDAIDRILRGAWAALRKTDLLEYKSSDADSVGFQRQGYHLRFESVAFDLIDEATLCPISFRWLDTVMKGPNPAIPLGITPYAVGTMMLDDVKIQDSPVRVPRPDRDLLQGDHTAELRNWLDQHPLVTELRNKGLWRDLNDAAMTFPTLLRSREHSAQQSSSKLKAFERAFKNDHLNVLNCSTTMEMGVDIGSLSMVAMNNAPPATTNYLQRAGRAGRRGQSTSVVLTFCKATPHGERIFADPTWPLSPTPVPRVALESATIVRRHVNALMLATFLLQAYRDESLLVSKVGDFFLSEFEVTKCRSFILWCLNTAAQDEVLRRGITNLIRGTALEGMSHESIAFHVSETMEQVERHWLARHEALTEELERADRRIQTDDGNTQEDFAYRRLHKQKLNMEREHLLGTLAERGFLPGYGFPTNVVELVTNNRAEARYRDDDKNRQFGYPSRASDVAIREYEPGKDVVLNGAVYRSAGLQLSWRVPDSKKEVPELQQLRFVGHCRCGYHTAGHTQFAEIPQNCPECNRYLECMEYIVPTGFQVDYRAPLHNDYTRPEYAAYIAPKLQIDHDDWQALGRSELGRFRATQHGDMFFYNAGQGAGFALCWHCGRTHALMSSLSADGRATISDAEINRIRRPHKRLQGTSRDGSAACPNEEWSLKVGQYDQETSEVRVPFVLGYTTRTTMLEIQLRNPLTNCWVNSTELAYSLGVAMRQVFCRQHGISDSEIGVAVQHRFASDSGSRASIFIYDNASQGAGYAMQMAEDLPKLLVDANTFAETCPNDACDRACHACLLDFSTQHQLNDLNRKAIIEYFLETRLKERLLLPEERQFFGSNSMPELLNAVSLLTLKGGRAQAIDVFVTGTDWDLANAHALRRLKFFTHQPVRLLFHESLAETIDPELAWRLLRAIDDEVLVELYSQPAVLENKAYPVMRMVLHDRDCWYATEDLSLTSLNAQWGSTQELCLVASKSQSYPLRTSAFDLEARAAKSSIENNMGLLRDFNKLTNLHIARFGERLLNEVLEIAPAIDPLLKNGIRRVEYRDKFLISPIGLMLVAEIFKGLHSRYGNFQAEITTSYPPESKFKPRHVGANYESDDQLAESLSGLSEAIGITILCELRDKKDLDHGRYLNIETDEGEVLQLLFDMGVGYWSKGRYYNRNRFNFDKCAEDMRDYQKQNITVRAADELSYIVVHQVVHIPDGAN